MGVLLSALIILLAPYQTHPVLSSTILGFTLIKWIGITALIVTIPTYLQRLGVQEGSSRVGVRNIWLLFILTTISWLYWHKAGASSSYSSCISLAIFGFVLFTVVNRYLIVIFLTYCAVVAMFISTLYIVKEVLILRIQYGSFIRPYGGTFEDSNYFAVSGVVVLPLAHYLFRREKNFWRKTVIFVMGGVIFAGTILTLSRGGLLGLIGAASTVIFLNKGKIKACFTILVLTVAVFFFMPTAMWDRIVNTRLAQNSEENVGDVASTTRRLTLYQSGLRMMLEHPFFGIGIGRFKEESLRYAPDLGTAGVGHSTIIEVGAELGIAALILFYWIEIDCIRKMRLIRKEYFLNSEIQALSSSLIASIVGFIVSGAFISAQYTKLHWFVLFIVLILYDRMADGGVGDFTPASWKSEGLSG